jgi:hypothetical protein
MSTLGEHKGNENLTETSRQREETKAQINGVLQHFDILASRRDRFIFKYIYVYLIGLFVPSAVLLIPFLLTISSQLQVQLRVFFVVGQSVISLVLFLSFLWPFTLWRVRAPKSLRDLLDQQRITLPDGDATTSYLHFLEDYRDALASPKRYFLSVFLMIVFGSLMVYGTLHFLFVEHLTSLATMLGVGGIVLFTFMAFGGLYCLGIVTCALYISGWHVRKLARVFEFSIQPFHPDQCGGLKLLGNFCFGLVSPLLIFSGVTIGFIVFTLVTAQGLDVVLLAAHVGFSLLLLLLLAFPVIVLAFLLPLWDIHAKMVSEGDTAENRYVARIQALREEIQALLDSNHIKEAKAVQEKKALVEALYTPYPTWPFHVRSKIFSTVLGVSGSLLLGVVTAAFQQYILTLLFHTP